MRNIKSIKLTIITLLTATFVGCGGGGGGSDASFESETQVAIADCSDATDPWTVLSSGDVVSADTNAQLTFDHDSNGNKQVCVNSGTAVVIKGS